MDCERLVAVSEPINLERLLRLRVVVARIGEMDRAQWWNTRGQLGPLGKSALSRGMPRTHYFAQARSVFAVAAHRCAELFDPPRSFTLWRLPQDIEEAFDARWENWLDSSSDWSEFFEQVAALDETDVAQALKSFQLVDDADLTALTDLSTSAEGRAVPLPMPFSATDADVTLLTLGFARGCVGAPAIPYARAVGE
jgi:hypothetical protein